MHADHQPPGAARAVHPATPPRRRGLRHAAGLAGLGLLAAAVPVVGLSAPAVAAVECTTETTGGLPILGPILEPACDDKHPPETTLGAITPQPNTAGWLRQGSVSITFTGAYQAVDDTDADPIALECKLDGPSQAHDWRPCTSPTSYDQLADTTGSTSYVFQVRAVDTADAAITVQPGLAGGETETVDDRDATPASTSFKIDTTTPTVAILGGPADALSPDDPVVWSRQVTVLVRSNERAATLQCRLDELPRSCQQGATVFRDLASGPHRIAVAAADAAGNTSAEAGTAFSVGTDLAASTVRRIGWRIRDGQDRWLDGNLVSAGRAGALLQIPNPDPISEVRLRAPLEARGAVRFRIGSGPWRKVSLGGRDAGEEVFVVRRRFEQPLTGPILIEGLTKGAVLDGIYAR